MNVVVSALVAGMCLSATQVTRTAAQETWLESFEGAWVLEGAVGADADLVVNITLRGRPSC